MTATDAEQTAAHFLRRKALAIIREERLTILVAKCHGDLHVADVVTARVQSSRLGNGRLLHAVDFNLLGNGRWTCTCRADGVCPHIWAAQLVTGHAPA